MARAPWVIGVLALGTLALSSWLHCGCAAPVGDCEPYRFHDQVAIERTIDVWESTTLPFGARCVSERPELHVRALPQDELDRCRLLEVGRGRINGCYASRDRTISVPRGVGIVGRQEVVIHQTLHWLHECNWGHTDHLHTGLLPSTRAMRAADVWRTQSTRSLESQARKRLPAAMPATLGAHCR